MSAMPSQPNMNPPRYFALIPAAGVGSRMGSSCPKQYALIAGKPMLLHVLDTFAASHKITHTFVVVSADDAYIKTMMSDAPHLAERVTVVYNGGPMRRTSVFNGLRAIRDQAADDDWVLVHDAARPCITAGLLDRLFDELRDDPVGGLLAVPVADTLKRADADQRVAQTESRDSLWQAQTPQMFRYGLLKRALQALGTDKPTDEAQAIEHLGFAPKLVLSDRNNLKVTFPEDLEMAHMILQARSAA